MSYWFVTRHQRSDEGQDDTLPNTLKETHGFKDDSNPFESECLTFEYGDRLHQQTTRDLTQLIEQIRYWIDDYCEGGSLPKVDIAKGLCTQCPFIMRCERIDDNPQDSWGDLENIATIPEIYPSALDQTE